jgi:prevent-host-death family protein
MKTATISEAKSKLSQLIDWVKAGETVLITDRDVPVAKLESVQNPAQGEAYGRIERLVRAGLARGPAEPLPKNWFKTHKPVKIKGGTDISKIISEERESGW